MEALLLHHNFFTPVIICQAGIQIAEILIALHEQDFAPMIYGDLKPEHIIYANTQWYLVDFGTISTANQSAEGRNNFGTQDFIAPERQRSNRETTLSDIYSFGKVFLYIIHNSRQKVPSALISIFERAAQEKETDRYKDTRSVRDALQQELNRIQQKKRTHYQGHLLKKAAVFGSEHHIGCTQFTVGLCVYLNHQGHKAVYLEKTKKDDIRKMYQENNAISLDKGRYRIGKLTAIPFYGPGILLDPLEEEIEILDCGVWNQYQPEEEQPLIREQWDQNSNCYIFLICGGSEWEMENSRSAYEFFRSRNVTNIMVIINHDRINSARRFSSEWDIPVYCYPMDRDLFHMTKEKLKFFSRLLQEKGGKA